MISYVNGLQSFKALGSCCHTPTQTFISHWTAESQFSSLCSLPSGCREKETGRLETLGCLHVTSIHREPVLPLVFPFSLLTVELVTGRQLSLNLCKKKKKKKMLYFEETSSRSLEIRKHKYPRDTLEEHGRKLFS